MCCIILCSHRVWNPNLIPSSNLNPSPAVEIGHNSDFALTCISSLDPHPRDVHASTLKLCKLHGCRLSILYSLMFGEV